MKPNRTFRVGVVLAVAASVGLPIASNGHPQRVGVLVRARHLCMACRGVRQQNSEMVTSTLLGQFRKQEVRAEFLNLVECQRER